MPKSCLPRFSQAHDFSKVVRHHLEHARLEPPSSLLVHRGPRREVIGQHPPWYAAANHVLQRVVDPPELVLTLRSILAHEAQAGRDERPFRIAAVTGVALLGHASTYSRGSSRWCRSVRPPGGLRLPCMVSLVLCALHRGTISAELTAPWCAEPWQHPIVEAVVAGHTPGKHQPSGENEHERVG